MPESEIRICCPSCSESFLDRIPTTARARSMFLSHMMAAHGLHPDSCDEEFDHAVTKASGGSRPLGIRRFRQLVQHAVELVEDGHSEGSAMFELIDEIDRLRGRPATSTEYGKHRGWAQNEENRMAKPPSLRRRAAREGV